MTAAVLLAVLVLYWVAVYRFQRGPKALAPARAANEAQFRAVRVDAPVPVLCFRGETAQVLLDKEDIIKNRYSPPQVSLWRICRNEHGEFFLFLSGKEPYLKHLSRDEARNALRGEVDLSALNLEEA